MPAPTTTKSLLTGGLSTFATLASAASARERDLDARHPAAHPQEPAGAERLAQISNPYLLNLRVGHEVEGCLGGSPDTRPVGGLAAGRSCSTTPNGSPSTWTRAITRRRAPASVSRGLSADLVRSAPAAGTCGPPDTPVATAHARCPGP